VSNPPFDSDTATPIVVLAVQDKRSLQALEPAVYLGKGQTNLMGLFLQAPRWPTTTASSQAKARQKSWLPR
jgi:hypothetical protein